MQTTAEKRWYLVQCKPKQDFRALENLQHQGYHCLLPTYQAELLRRGQWAKKEEPLFPGYLFIELDSLKDNWMSIRSTRGVNQVVRFGDTPLPIPAQVIDNLKKSQAFDLNITLQPGSKVHLSFGGTQYLEAIFLARDGTERVLLLLNILQRELRISAPTKSLIRL